MTVTLLAPLWADNSRIQSAANNRPALRQNDRDSVAVSLLQQALILSGFPPAKGADGHFGPETARAVVATEKSFGFCSYIMPIGLDARPRPLEAVHRF